MDIEKIKSLSIIDYLAKRGLHPKRQSGKTAQFLSPFGKETQASFMVNLAKNRFFDYHAEESGDLLDLVQALENCSFKEAIQLLSGDEVSQIETYTPPKIQKEGTEILKVDGLSDAELIDYMTQVRKIGYDVLMKYYKEVSFRFPHSLKDPTRVYTAVGFKNDMSGYDLRSSWMKIASSPKMFTTVLGERDDVIDLWEGNLDFSSYLTAHNRLTPINKTYVLNGARMIRILKPFLDGKTVRAYVDQDKAGDEVIEELDNCTVIDCRHEFLFYNDYNAYWCDI